MSDDADEEDLTVEADLGSGNENAPEEGKTQADDATADDGTAPEADVDPESPQGRMERALTAVRREGRKAAAIYAVADGVAAMLAVNVALATVASAVPYPTVLAVLAGVAVCGGEFWLRTRRSLVERFEAANPAVAGPLRTARDAVESGADNRMAARLYEETLERLRDASGVALVDDARVAATGIVVVVLCLASLQVSVVGLSFLGDDTTTAVDDRPEAVTPEPDGLRDGGAVLGDPDPVDRGSEDVTAEVEANEGDGPIEEDRNFPSDGGGAGGADVETRQAAFSRPDRVENAELVREYNLRIREQE
ncbi:hypothetical protein BRD05_00720 [Halobacteriales archaeon QS_9_70_65]|nr:MAG: hypothetical protein BRD05_00720 [Halobacteriales archaeon QS_9_70_65]